MLAALKSTLTALQCGALGVLRGKRTMSRSRRLKSSFRIENQLARSPWAPLDTFSKAYEEAT